MRETIHCFFIILNQSATQSNTSIYFEQSIEMGSNHSKEELESTNQNDKHVGEGEDASQSDGEFVEEYEEEKIQEEDQQIEAKLTDHLGKTCKVSLITKLYDASMY